MTTEILRNLIYEDPARLDLVRYVVLDEVHYIDDFPRGSVWEEIVIQAPLGIKLVGLSATIGNYREIADWMAENRGGMETVFHDVRPVELKMWLAIHNRFLPLFKEDGAIDQVAAERLAGLKDRDEETLFRRMVDARLLRRGLAEHHAGLLPYHKEMVEELFQRGLIKTVFATETLSLGINMPARAVAVSSFTKFDGVNFSHLTTGELTQLMGRAGRRGIDVIGHGVILKESDVEVGTIYEVAMGPTLVVESKFLPSYNMALNLLRVYAPAEAEALMQRSFGQFQKRLAADQTQERLVNVRARLGDIRQMWDDPEVSLEDVGQYFKLEERRRSIRIELKRLRREAGAARHARHGRRGRGQVRSMGGAEQVVQKLEIEAKGLLERQRKLKVVHSPRFGEYLQRYGEIRSLQRELDQGQHELGGQMDEYARKLRRLCRILAETGFLDHNKPTDKGLFASRVYSENTILVAEAVWAGWLEGLAAEELCAVLVMLAAEDRNVPRRRDEGGAGRHSPRRYPTHGIAQCARPLVGEPPRPAPSGGSKTRGVMARQSRANPATHGHKIRRS